MSEDGGPATKPTLAQRFDRSWWRWIAGTLLLASVFVLMLPTLMRWSAGAFEPRQMFLSVSPDGSHRVSVNRRVQFPAMDVLDPSIWIEVELTDIRSGQRVDGIGVGLFEISDFGSPKAAWDRSGAVTIRNLDDRRSLSVTLRAMTLE